MRPAIVRFAADTVESIETAFVRLLVIITVEVPSGRTWDDQLFVSSHNPENELSQIFCAEAVGQRKSNQHTARTREDLRTSVMIFIESLGRWHDPVSVLRYLWQAAVEHYPHEHTVEPAALSKFAHFH